MIRKINILSVMLFFVIGVMACKSQSAIPSNHEKIEENMPNKLTTSSWILESVSDGEKSISPKAYGEEIPVITFNLEELKVQGFDGCNTFSGSFTIQGDSQIEIDKRLKSTRMFCEGVPSGTFLRALFNVTQYEVKGNKLVLKSDSQQLITLVKQE